MSENLTAASFRSQFFNFTETKEGYINPTCFGDDLAQWLMEELELRGQRIDPGPNQEDFGWYFTWQLGDTAVCVLVGRRGLFADPDGDWILWLERQSGFFRSLFGARKKGIPTEAQQLLNEILVSSRKVTDLRWQRSEDLDRRAA